MSAIRALRQVSLSSARVFSTRSACVARSSLFSPAVKQASRSFSVSPRAFGQGTSALSILDLASCSLMNPLADVALAAKLQEELSYEVEGVTPKETPAFIKDFKAEGIWKVRFYSRILSSMSYSRCVRLMMPSSATKLASPASLATRRMSTRLIYSSCLTCVQHPPDILCDGPPQ